MRIQHQKTIYEQTEFRKATRIFPVISTQKPNVQRLIQCEFEENNNLQTERFEHVCIIPVTDKDKKNFCVEKGNYYSVIMDENFKEISRGEPIPSVKLYLDSQTFRNVISIFGNKKLSI